MDNLNELRNQFTRNERDVLSTIWYDYRKDNEWMSTRGIHKAGGGKNIVRPILEKFGGSIVYETEQKGSICYCLTFLGLLLSAGGEALEGILLQYIILAKNLANKDVKRTHISSQEVSIRQKLEPEEVLSLGHVLFFSPFISGGSFSAQEWNAGLPKDIEDIPDDLSAYIQNMALSTYDPNVPLPSQERKVYLNSKSTKPPEEILPFMNDKHLRAIATQDWSETKLCFTAKAWKYTVIACGSVLEAILLDALLGKPDEAYAAYKANHPDRARSKDLLRWGLDDLVDAAEKMKLIDEASFHLGHALRLHRDLVHPGRQLKEPVEVSEGEAQISKDTVEKCIRDFSARFREGEEREG